MMASKVCWSPPNPSFEIIKALKPWLFLIVKSLNIVHGFDFLAILVFSSLRYVILILPCLLLLLLCLRFYCTIFFFFNKRVVSAIVWGYFFSCTQWHQVRTHAVPVVAFTRIRALANIEDQIATWQLDIVVPNVPARFTHPETTLNESFIITGCINWHTAVRTLAQTDKRFICGLAQFARFKRRHLLYEAERGLHAQMLCSHEHPFIGVRFYVAVADLTLLRIKSSIQEWYRCKDPERAAITL